MKLPFIPLIALIFSIESGWAETALRIAGSGSVGSDGDRGPALMARLNSPFGVVRGSDRSLWFADYEAHVVRRIAPDGIITTVIGNGTAAYSGDNGPAKNASLNKPHELRFDADGNLFISDTGNHAIRRYDAKSGLLTTFAGNGQKGYSGDDGPADQARLNQPISLQFSPAGDLYIAEIGNHVLRRIDPKTRVITTFAGTGKAGPTPDGSPIRGTPLNGPRSLDFDTSGNLFLISREGHQLLRFDLRAGIIHLEAGTGRPGFSGDGGPARAATLNGPKGISVGPDGDVYLADTENHAIRKYDVRRRTLETVVGTGTLGDGLAGSRGPTQLARPHGILAETDGSLLIGDSENHRILSIRLPRKP